MALAAVCLVWAATSPHGIAVSPDSVGYISAARNLAAGRGLTTFDGAPLTLHPPLYPALLGAFKLLTGVDPLPGSRLLNSVLFGLTVYLSGLYFARHIVRSVLVLLGVCSVFLSPSLFQVAAFAWSEPLFILLSLLFLPALEAYLEGRSKAALLVLAAVVGLACLTRYIGVALALAGGLAVLLQPGSLARARAVHAALFGAVALAPPGAWMLRNLLLTESLAGDRLPSHVPLHENLYLALIGCLDWLVPVSILAGTTSDGRALLLLGAAGGYVLARVASPQALWRWAQAEAPRIGPSLLFVGVYLGSLTVSSSLASFEPIGYRYLSPIYLPAVLIALSILDRMTRGEGQCTWKLPGTAARASGTAVAGVALALWLVYPAAGTAFRALRQMGPGVGYSQVGWRNSETMRYVESRLLTAPGDVRIYSNAPDAIYHHLNAVVARSPAVEGEFRGPAREPVGAIAPRWPESPMAYLVWFDRSERPYLYQVAELGQIAVLTQLARLQDGTVYTVSGR